MNLPFVRSVCMFALLAALGLGPGVSPAAGAREQVSDIDKGVDVLTHGPIHEAFAESVALDPEPGIIVPKAPPYDIDEIPPTQKPEGDVDWIPGYWAWDDDQNDFIWVSGIWRAVPPNRQWVPGYRLKPDRMSMRRHRIMAGCPAVGYGFRDAMCGGPVIGRLCGRTGSGSPTITFGRPGAIFL